ncbi:MAG: hydratase [Burkholderiaceae bacterium]|nr:hydratase [Burkholderiaceae bacterium]
MTPEDILRHLDRATLWPARAAGAVFDDVAAAYQVALAVRALRVARGERPVGYKIGFTNRTIWPRYGVYAPIWGTVYDRTLQLSDGHGEVGLSGLCQPRLEPEVAFGIARTPPANPTLEQLFGCIHWVAPSFEVVQSHQSDWKFSAAESIADGALHGALALGQRQPVHDIAASGVALDARLANTRVRLCAGTAVIDEGDGARVLDGPLHALHHFVLELQRCPGAPGLHPGDVVTTGTWTDAWPVKPGEVWRAEFGAPLPALDIAFS